LETTLTQKKPAAKIREYIPFFCLAAYMLAFHLMIPLGWGDDLVFTQDLMRHTVPEYVGIAVQNWSSRFIIYNSDVRALRPSPHCLEAAGHSGGAAGGGLYIVFGKRRPGNRRVFVNW
jgi:hypothetical protein